MLDGGVYVEQFAPPSLARPEVWELMERIEVSTRRRSTRLGATADSSRTWFTTGMARWNGWSERRRRIARSARRRGGQFRGLVHGLITAERQAAIEQLVLTGSDDADARELAALLAGEVGTAFPDEGSADEAVDLLRGPRRARARAPRHGSCSGSQRRGDVPPGAEIVSIGDDGVIEGASA